jgi:uncharacterized protein (DUF302 family)
MALGNMRRLCYNHHGGTNTRETLVCSDGAAAVASSRRLVEMKYYVEKKVNGSFEQVVERTRTALGAEGFGVITEIDVRETMKKKLGIEFRNYIILGACNPPLAHRALETENKIGVLLPCNVIVQETDDGVEIAAMDPVAAMGAIGNEGLTMVAGEVKSRLDRVVESVV